MNDDSGSGLSGPGNVVLRTGEDADCEESACMDLLDVAEPSDVDVLFVTFTKSAGDRLDALKRHAAAPPAKVGVVSVQVGGSNGGDHVGGNGPTVRRISDPSDLTGVGIAISEFLSAWSSDGNRTVVCFESLTALLQYVDASRVFQFCNEITSKFEQAGARAHFHITPEAHERQELSVLSSLFDGRVSPADLAGGPEAAATTDRSTDGAAPRAETADEDAVDAAADSSDEDADPTEDDPFEYAVADADDGPADGASVDDESTLPVEESSDVGVDDAAADVDGGTDDAGSPNRTDDGDGDDGPPDGDPANLVSSVIAGEADGADAGPSLDADIPDPDGPDADASDDRPEATSRRTERDELQRRLEYIGPDASTPEGSTEDADDEEARTTADDGDETADRPDKYAFYQRTTATVVGVVVMLVLISFLSAAMPVPIGTDAPVDDGGDLTPTATSEEVAVADSTGENGTTATEETSTPAPTATPTDTSTPDSSTSTSSTSGSDDGSTTEETSTPEPTPTETATPTETSSDDDGLTDVLDTDDDGDLL